MLGGIRRIYEDGCCLNLQTMVARDRNGVKNYIAIRFIELYMV